MFKEVVHDRILILSLTRNLWLFVDLHETLLSIFLRLLLDATHWKVCYKWTEQELILYAPRIVHLLKYVCVTECLSQLVLVDVAFVFDCGVLLDPALEFQDVHSLQLARYRVELHRIARWRGYDHYLVLCAYSLRRAAARSTSHFVN